MEKKQSTMKEESDDEEEKKWSREILESELIIKKEVEKKTKNRVSFFPPSSSWKVHFSVRRFWVKKAVERRKNTSFRSSG